ncbi:MAG: MarR family transcriptional regulator [Desulfurococcaceae archaeon]|nr:MarR family transcriptional regulator [Desulfurococcaceae archaeon]
MNIVTKILEILSGFPEGVPQPYLAKALGVSKSYLSLVLRDLEKRGLIYRVKIGNTYIVRLTRMESRSVARGKVLRLGIVWSSEYLFLGYFAKILRDREDIELKVYVYPNALQTVLALLRGDVDAVLSPLVTQVYGYILSRNFSIVGGGASGGGYIYEIPNSGSNIIASSGVSTMDFCRALALKKGYVEASVEDTMYFESAQEALSIAKRGLVRYLVVWHPINIDIEGIGGRKIFECSEIEELSYCCTLAISRSIGFEIVEKVADIYRESIDLFNRDKERFLEWYSNVVGIDIAVLRKALKEYVYKPELTFKQFTKFIDVLDLEVPTKNYIYNAIKI